MLQRCQRVRQCKDRPADTHKQKENRIMQPLLVDQIKAVHLLFMLMLLVPLHAEAQEAKLLQLFLLYTELQLPEDPFLLQLRLLHRQPSQLQLRATLWPLPTAVQQMLSQRLQLRGLPVLLPPVLQLPRLLLCGMLSWLPRRPQPVPELPVAVLQLAAAFMLQVPVVLLRWGAFLPRQGSMLRRLVPRCPGGDVVPRVLLRLRVLLPQVQRRMPVPAVRQSLLCRWMLMLS
uniref:Uncharacterized protein n=1 Tax=Arundo donax TaxID=35708 RepID=A0A0A9GDL7_ARUDO